MVSKILVTIFALIVLLMAGRCFALEIDCSQSWQNDVLNVCKDDKFEPDSTVEHHESFDWGAWGNVILWETANTEFGVFSTFAYQTNETRLYLGGKVYLNRFTWQKYRKKR